MVNKLLGLAAALALPAVLAAQTPTPTIPNEHASDKGKEMVALHSQGAQHRATQRRGEVAGGLVHRPGWIAIPPVGRATPQPGGATPPVAPPTGTPPFKATPAQPPQKPSSPGQSGNHRP